MNIKHTNNHTERTELEKKIEGLEQRLDSLSAIYYNTPTHEETDTYTRMIEVELVINFLKGNTLLYEIV